MFPAGQGNGFVRDIAGIEHQKAVAKARIVVSPARPADIAPVPWQAVGPFADKPSPAGCGLTAAVGMVHIAKRPQQKTAGP